MRHRGIVGVPLKRVVRCTRPVLRRVLVLSRALEVVGDQPQVFAAAPGAALLQP